MEKNRNKKIKNLLFDGKLGKPVLVLTKFLDLEGRKQIGFHGILVSYDNKSRMLFLKNAKSFVISNLKPIEEIDNYELVCISYGVISTLLFYDKATNQENHEKFRLSDFEGEKVTVFSRFISVKEEVQRNGFAYRGKLSCINNKARFLMLEDAEIIRLKNYLIPSTILAKNPMMSLNYGIIYFIRFDGVR